MSREVIKVKMRNNKIEVITHEDAEYEEVKSQLFLKLDSLAHFLTKGKPIVLIAGKDFTEGQRRELTGIIRTDYNVSDVDFCSLEQLDQLHEEADKEVLAASGFQETPPSSLFKFGRINYGEMVEVSGDITIVGDVELGAELRAGGSICVLGALRGTAFAGTDGDMDAVIVANILEAQKLGIGTCVGVAPKDNKSAGAAEFAHMHEGNIVIELVSEEKDFDDENRQRGIISSIKRFFTYDH